MDFDHFFWEDNQTIAAYPWVKLKYFEYILKPNNLKQNRINNCKKSNQLKIRKEPNDYHLNTHT